VVSSLSPKHVIGIVTLVPDQDTGRSDTFVKSRLHASGPANWFHAIFNLLKNFTRCFAGLIMCLIYIDESVTRVGSCTTITSLCWTVYLTVWITTTRCTVLKVTHSSGCAWTERTHVTVAARCFLAYKYPFCLTLITISHSSF
jgi:hypothetical protein